MKEHSRQQSVGQGENVARVLDMFGGRVISTYGEEPRAERARRPEGARAGATAVRLDKGGSNLGRGLREGARYRIVGGGCQHRGCEKCGPRRGYDTREVILGKVEKFTYPKMLSLTVDRLGTTTGRGFVSPLAAHEYVTSRALIPELMRRAGIAEWVWVQEFQSETGDGWSHWHIIINAKWVKLKLLWHLWRDLWGVGGVDLQRDARGKIIEWKNAEHAVNYITEYLVKVPEAGYPDWVLDAEKRVRLVGASKAVGALTRLRPGEDELESDEERERERPRTMRKALEECGASCVLVEEGVDRQTGEVISRYAGYLPLSHDLVGWLSRGVERKIEGLERETVEEPDGRMWSRLYVNAAGVRALLKLREDPDIENAEHERMARRKREIAERWERSQFERCLRSGEFEEIPPRKRYRHGRAWRKCGQK